MSEIPEDLKTLYTRVKNSHVSAGWKWGLGLIERIGRLEATIAERDKRIAFLESALGKLQAEYMALADKYERAVTPVSDEEWELFASFDDGILVNRRFAEQSDVDALIAARKAQPKP